MNIKKERFMAAVRIVAQGDEFIVTLADGVMEEQLPEYPGSIALLFVTAFANLREGMDTPRSRLSPTAKPSSIHSPRRTRHARPQSIPVRWCQG
jgi:hypothetical protein